MVWLVEKKWKERVSELFRNFLHEQSHNSHFHNRTSQVLSSNVIVSQLPNIFSSLSLASLSINILAELPQQNIQHLNYPVNAADCAQQVLSFVKVQQPELIRFQLIL